VAVIALLLEEAATWLGALLLVVLGSLALLFMGRRHAMRDELRRRQRGDHRDVKPPPPVRW
jgi:hypothetical protein